MSLNIDSCSGQYPDNPLLDASMAIRYPKANKNPEIMCYVCLDENVQQGADFSVYEKVVCHGLKCQANGQGAVSWVCETCALEMDLRLMVAEKTNKKPKRNMVCDCQFGSHVGVTTYVVKDDAAYKLLRSQQYGINFDGIKLFSDRPSKEMLVANPDAFVEHMMACRKTDQDGKFETVPTFNTAIADLYNDDESQRVSVQLVWNKKKQVMSVIVSAAVTSVNIIPVRKSDYAQTKGIGSSTKKQCVEGTSSEDAFVSKNDKSTGNVVEIAMPFQDLAGDGQEVVLVCDGILPPGSAAGMLKHLENTQEQSTVPSFCPIRTISEIATCVSATSLEDGTKRAHFLELVEQYKLKYKIVDDKFVLVDTDTGKACIFTDIAKSLEICGFGERAMKFDWHMVVLRRGRYFLTLYILVVHAPYPGLWIIAERLTIGKTVDECTTKTIMVGQDVAPLSFVENQHFLLERGLWDRYTMYMFMGFSEHSSALLKCLNRDCTQSGPYLRAMFDESILTMKNVERGFLDEQRSITMQMAAKDMASNNTYITKVTAEFQAIQKLKGMPDVKLFPGTVVAVGKYGVFRVVAGEFAKHYSEDEADNGKVISKVTVVTPDNGPPVMYYVVNKSTFIGLTLCHFRHNHVDTVQEETTLTATYIDNKGDESHFDDMNYTVGDWRHRIDQRFGSFDTDDTNCSVLVRDPDNNILLQIRFDMCTD